MACSRDTSRSSWGWYDRAPAVLIVFAGPACSGKSTLASEVARRYGLPHYSMDGIRQRILPQAAHTRDDRRVAYRVMHLLAGELARAGAGAVLDAPYGHPEDRDELAAVARDTGADVRWIECQVSPATAVVRFRQRGADPVRLDLTEELVERLAREHHYTGAGLLLDTETLSPGECLRRIDAWIAERPGPV